jgi:Na+/H+-dicarboxylate symporter
MHHISKHLTIAIFIALISGAIIGLSFADTITDPSTQLSYYVDLGGRLFVQTLKYMAIPMVLVSIIVGVVKVGSFESLTRIGLKALLLFAITTIIAAVSSLTVTTLINPKFPLIANGSVHEAIDPQSSIFESIGSVLLRNPFTAIAEGNMLHIIFLAVIIGIMMLMCLPKNHSIFRAFEKVHEVTLTIIILFMWTAPFGVFCLMVKSFSTLGLEAIAPMASYVGIVVLMLFFQLFVVYPLFLMVGAGMSPAVFYRKIKNPFMVAFSTASSNATLPVTLETVEDELNIDPSISSFVIPLGATINMDSLAISYGVASVLLANAAGIDLTMWQYATIVILTVFASIGTAGVPGVGLLALAMVLEQVHVPIYGIPILMGIGRLNDMLGSAINVTGDIVVTAVVAKSEQT